MTNQSESENEQLMTGNSAKELQNGSKDTDASAKPQKKAKNLVLVFTLLIGLVFVGAASYGGYWAYLQLQNINNQLTEQKNKVQTLETELAQQLPKLENQLVQSNTGYQAQIDEVRQYLIETARRMTESQGVTRYEWLLAEAEYLMRLAQQRLQLEGDSIGALSILQSADAILRDTGDANLIPVRQQLAREMAELARIKQIDREGLYLKLNVLIDDFNQWSPALALAEQLPDELSDRENISWKDRFSKYISISKLDALEKEPVQQHLIPLYRAILQHSLAQAQTALLKNQTLAFHSAISRAKDWLQQYGTNPAFKNTLEKQLDQLSQLDLESDLPNIGESLTLLKGYIAEIYLLQRNAPEEQSR